MWSCSRLTSAIHVFQFLLLLHDILLTHQQSMVYHDYCVIGAGPAGVQMGYFLHRAGRDYVVFEKENITASFFTRYPRLRKLVSINKRHTGQTNKEFNLRHDWNSLISDDESLLFRHYSKKMFPHADDYVRYLNDFQRKLNISVQFNTEIRNLSAVKNESALDGHHFTMKDQNGTEYKCTSVIVAAGASKPVLPYVSGIEYTEGYETVSLNPDDYEGKTVLIIQNDHSGYELAQSIYGSSNYIHIAGLSRVRLSWATHYIGDIRAIHNDILDTYMLKSLDGVGEATESLATILKNGNKLFLKISKTAGDNVGVRYGYDKIIHCLGFSYDRDLFTNLTAPDSDEVANDKFPKIAFNYESLNVKGMYFAGVMSHGLDYRKSAGGFIHGFRYTARALHRMMEYKYEGVPWPSKTAPYTQLMNHMLKRVNEASGIYQMFSFLGDVIVLRDDTQEFEYFEEFPIYLIHKFPSMTGRPADRVVVLNMQYGTNFSGPGNDVFRSDRATGDPADAHNSNFLHPVLYYYEKLPSVEEVSKSIDNHKVLPRPTAVHHMVEDFLIRWDAPKSHILPLRRFIESIIGTDMRHFFSESCLQMAMTHTSVPVICQSQFLNGQGLTGTRDLHQFRL